MPCLYQCVEQLQREERIAIRVAIEVGNEPVLIVRRERVAAGDDLAQGVRIETAEVERRRRSRGQGPEAGDREGMPARHSSTR